jgi:hypothetical protein
MKAILIFILFLFIRKDPSNTYTLISKPKTTLGCGGILFAGGFLFINNIDSSEKIGIILCPGDDFKLNHKYTVEFSADSIIPPAYSMMNVFDTSRCYIPKRIITKINEVK